MPKPAKLIVILGPTASGKTGWAFKLCKKFNGEIVSADSRQIYRHMNIGTGKNVGIGCANPPANSVQISQYLIDIVNPDEILTLSQYKKLAINAINDIISRGKVPFLVGGTGLYISAIVDNLEIPEVEPDWRLREKLELKSLEELQMELKQLDPEFYKEVDLNNRRRLIRAIESSKISGKPFSTLRKKGAPLFDCLQIGIDISKEELHKKIDKRVDEMRKAGLEEEARKLAEKYSWDLPSMSGIGYREFMGYCHCEEDVRQRSKPVELHPNNIGFIFAEIKKHTRQYAKRQMTFFRRDSRIMWTSEYEVAKNTIKYFLEH